MIVRGQVDPDFMKTKERIRRMHFTACYSINLGYVQVPCRVFWRRKITFHLCPFTGPASCVEHAFAACMVGSIILDCPVLLLSNRPQIKERLFLKNALQWKSCSICCHWYIFPCQNECLAWILFSSSRTHRFCCPLRDEILIIAACVQLVKRTGINFIQVVITRCIPANSSYHCDCRPWSPPRFVSTNSPL